MCSQYSGAIEEHLNLLHSRYRPLGTSSIIWEGLPRHLPSQILPCCPLSPLYLHVKHRAFPRLVPATKLKGSQVTLLSMSAFLLHLPIFISLLLIKVLLFTSSCSLEGIFLLQYVPSLGRDRMVEWLQVTMTGVGKHDWG